MAFKQTSIYKVTREHPLENEGEVCHQISTALKRHEIKVFFFLGGEY